MYTNFRIEKILLDHGIPEHLKNLTLFQKIIAKVDCTIGYLWWKKVRTITVFNTTGGAGYWRDLETGKFTKGLEIENMYQAYQIKNKLDNLSA